MGAKTLIVVSHGEYNRDSGKMTENGVDGIKKLSLKLRPYVCAPIAILSSPVLYAAHAAAMLAFVFKNSREAYDTSFHLWAPDVFDAPAFLPAIGEVRRLCQGSSDGTVIVVTHTVYTAAIPDEVVRYFRRPEESLGPEVFPLLGRSEAYVLHLNDHEFIRVKGKEDE